MSGPSVEAARETRLKNAFATEELSALNSLMYVRMIASAAIIVFLLIRFPDAGGVYWAALTVVFALIGIAQFLLGRSRFHARWQKYVFIALDVALVTFIIVYPNPFYAEWFPPPMMLKFPNFDFLYVVVAIMALSYAPGAVAWGGFAAVIAWGAGVVWILYLPATVSHADYPEFASLAIPQQVQIATQPHFLDFFAWSQQTFVMLVFAGVLASVV